VEPAVVAELNIIRGHLGTTSLSLFVVIVKAEKKKKKKKLNRLSYVHNGFLKGGRFISGLPASSGAIGRNIHMRGL
jgi:hypothetical protein